MKKINLLNDLPGSIVKIIQAVIVVGFIFIQFGFNGYGGNSTTEIMLANNGQAMHSIVVGSGASEQTTKAAGDLAVYLGRIVGGEFEVKIGDGATGIAVGSFKDFPLLELDGHFNSDDISRRDEFLLQTHEKGVYLVGATDLAAQHAVWDFLYRIGYRQFFPMETWEYVPHDPDLKIKLNEFEQPDFYNRNGPRAAAWGDGKLWRRWHDRNLITSSFTMSTGHSYNSIINRNKQVFNEHPEYLSLVDGVRGGGQGDKFCISNKNLRQLVIEDARKQIEANPDITSISMDPSDGSDWCECNACAEMGSISDRVVILANEVAEAINQMGYGEKYVGIYAYNDHSPPPNVNLHPKVVVNIATSYIKGGYTLEDLINQWSERSDIIGLRDYYSTYVWDQGLPRGGHGGSVEYLVKMIPWYYEKGIRFMNANSTDAWSAYGLGYYLSARLLWDVDQAEQVEVLIDDFLNKSFGAAHEPMRQFYNLVAMDYKSLHTNNDLLAHMYGYIKEARELTIDPKVHARLDELALYTRYVELWFKLNDIVEQDARDKAAQELFCHAYRMQSRMMVDIKALYNYLIRININIPESAYPGNLIVGRQLEDMAPWKSSREFTDDEIAQFIADGDANFNEDDINFKPISFSEDLVPAREMLNLPEVSTGDLGRFNRFRGRQKIFTWLNRACNSELHLAVTGGLIEYYRDRGNVRFKLFFPHKTKIDPVFTDESVPPDGETYQVVLKSTYEGLHQLEWDDGDDQTLISWEEGIPMTVKSSATEPAKLLDNRKLYFYVPKGTEIVGGFTSGHNNGRTQVYDGAGNQVYIMGNVEGGEGYFSIPVPQGQDGKLWSFRKAYGTQVLMTVPPYLARNEKELLLPREVVEADGLTSKVNNDIIQTGTIHVYPNPTKERLHINYDRINEIEGIAIFNSEGKCVKILSSGEIDSGIKTIDVSTFLPDLYFVQVKFKDRVITKKILKE
ncbi:MAG TPA: DUF4838 domain-containing protein [Mariniphaga sp.]|nr:DUF4838 domain-containing protein [Mariniphaga sp.]